MSSDTASIIAKLREREQRILDSVIYREVATPADADRAIEASDLYRIAADALERDHAIVAELANAEAWVEVMTDYDASEIRCHFCGGETPNHDGTCLYRRAREAAG